MKKSLLSLSLCFVAASGVISAAWSEGVFSTLAETQGEGTVASAQLPNSDFSKFEDDTDNTIGDRPIGWKASNVNQAMKAQLVYDMFASGEGVLMQNKFVGIAFLNLGANAPAYITLGTPWNYVKGTDASTGDGGTYGGISFTYRPDSVRVTYKRVMGKENTKENAKVLLYAWKGQVSATSNAGKWSGNMIDREQDVLGMTTAEYKATKSEDFALVSNTEYTIAPCTMDSFETVSIPLNYVNKEVAPEKINVILSSADYYVRANIGKDNKLYVKNLTLVYNHELTSVVYDGQTYQFTDGALDLSSVVYDPSKISFEKKGVGATVETKYDAASAVLTVDVLGSDYAADNSSKTSYTVKFKYVEPAAIDSVKIGNEKFTEFKKEQTSYTLPYAYHPGIVIEGVAAKGSQVVMDGMNKAFYDNDAKTITLKVAGAAADTVNYVFHFTEVVDAPEAGAYKGGLLVTLTNKDGESGKSPLMSNEVLKITKNSNGTVNLAIDNFSFIGMVVGDIFVSNVPVVNDSISVEKVVRLTSYGEDGQPNASALGWNLGALPLKVNVVLHPEVGKFAEASIDILTGQTFLASMFKNIHVDIVPFEFEASEPIMAEKPWGSVNYYSFIKAKGYMTKNSAKFLQLTNSYVNEDGVLIDNPMDYMDLTEVTFEKGVKLADLMVGAPAKNNTLVYVNKDARLFGNNVIKNGETSKLVMKDGLALNAPQEFIARGVNFDRKFVPGQPETLVLPFDAPMSAVSGQVFELVNLNGKNFDMKPVMDTVRANKPYIIYATQANAIASPGRVTVIKTDSVEATAQLGDLTFQGVYAAKEFKATDKDLLTYYTLENGKFAKATQKGQLNPFRGMIATENETLADTLSFNVAPTALKGMKVSGEAFAEFSADKHEYTLPFAYNPGVVIEGIPANNELFVCDANQYPFLADNVAKTITVKAYNAVKDTVTYVFNFTDTVESAESGDYKGALSVSLDTPYGDPQATPFENSSIKISANSNGTVNLAISNFSFAGLPVGDIFVPNAPVVDNKVVAKRYIRLTSFLDDGVTPNPGSMGAMLGILPVSVKATLHTGTDKVIDASIDILTGETQLSSMFENIHVDFVTFQIGETDKYLQAENGSGLGYYPCLTPTGRLTKASAKFLQVNNSYVNSSKKQIDSPMTYLDLTKVRMDADVTFEDVMTGAPVKNNTLVYVPATSKFEGKNLVKGEVAQNVELTDSVAFGAAKAFKAETLSFNSNFEVAENALSSIVLPFEVALENVNGKVYKLESVNGEELNFKIVSGKLEANKPYLVAASESQLLKNLSEVAVSATPAEAMEDVVADYTHFAAYSAEQVKSSAEKTFYTQNNAEFQKVAQTNLVPFHTLMATALETPAEVLVVKLDNVPTGIIGVNTELGKVDVYTVEGKLVRSQVDASTALQGLSQGVYVVGGKKVVL